MSEWMRFVFTAIAVAIGIYVTITTTVQNHDYRIDQLEKNFNQHMDQHKAEYKEIQTLLTDLKVSVAKIGNK